MAYLRPAPARAAILAAGAIALTVAIVLIDERFTDTWAAGPRLLVTGAAAAFLLAVAFAAPDEPDQPRPWLSTVLVCCFVLSLFALGNLADALGADGEFNGSGTLTWVALALTGLFAAFAVRRDSAVCTLLAGIMAVVTVLAFTDWAFDPSNVAKPWRWILLVATAAFLAAGAALRAERPRHAIALVDVAALTALGLAVAVAIDVVAGLFGDGGGSGNVAWGWELCVLAAGGAVAGFAILWRAAGPGYLAAAVLLAFVFMAASGDDDPSLIGWPIVVLVIAVAALGTALRPETTT
jgi:hypothetical protein